jgi:hypothetical protein
MFEALQIIAEESKENIKNLIFINKKILLEWEEKKEGILFIWKKSIRFVG